MADHMDTPMHIQDTMEEDSADIKAPFDGRYWRKSPRLLTVPFFPVDTVQRNAAYCSNSMITLMQQNRRHETGCQLTELTAKVFGLDMKQAG